MEAGKQRLAGDTKREANSTEVTDLKKENGQLKHLLAEPMLKNLVKLEHYYSLWQLDRAIGQFAQHYNHERYHESLDNVTPADMYLGQYQEIMDRKAIIKQTTLQQMRRVNLAMTACQ